jgi:signal transduction histidine kinase
MTYNEQSALVIWTYDITDRKEAEAVMEQARDLAERANQTKAEFLANMSHELRTPLNAIIGYSQILQEEMEDSGHGDVLPDLKRIESAGKHLLGLINDMLDLSKIEAGRIAAVICILLPFSRWLRHFPIRWSSAVPPQGGCSLRSAHRIYFAACGA